MWDRRSRKQSGTSVFGGVMPRPSAHAVGQTMVILISNQASNPSARPSFVSPAATDARGRISHPARVSCANGSRTCERRRRNNSSSDGFSGLVLVAAPSSLGGAPRNARPRSRGPGNRSLCECRAQKGCRLLLPPQPRETVKQTCFSWSPLLYGSNLSRVCRSRPLLPAPW
jgi:hypothetical protein